MHCTKKRAAFTLVELLVVIGIIALLAAILFPVFAQARQAARKAVALSNMKQIAIAVLLYTQDYDEMFPRTQETLSQDEPDFISYWDTHYYQKSLEPYMKNGMGGVDKNGNSTGKGSVWFEPSDPLKDDGVMWGSFCNNGMVTGVTRTTAEITNPASTIFSSLRSAQWYQFIGITPPNPLPLSNTSDPFWSSDYWDICINPWKTDAVPGSYYHWSNGHAVPPSTQFASNPEMKDWDQGIDGLYKGIPNNKPRYGNGQTYSFCDGHVKWMPFEQTYKAPNNNMWSTNQNW